MSKVIRKKNSSRKARPPVSVAEIQRLGFECEHWAEANAMVKTRRSLAELFKKHPKLREAWSRGRFLRNLGRLTRVGTSIAEAAKLLGLENRQVLRAMIDEDEEVGKLWIQARCEFCIKIESAIVKAVEKGKPATVRALKRLQLAEEKERLSFDPYHTTIVQLARIMGKPTQTIHDWHTKYGLPRNPDGTFNFKTFFVWWEALLLSL